MAARTYTLGVDLGTTYSAAAIGRGDRAERFPLGNRSAVVPSVVCLRADGEVLVGDAAERRGLLEPTRTAREFKRRLGDPTPLLLGGTPYGAEALMAHLLRWIVGRVEEQQGGPPSSIVLSHPANWGPFKLDLLQQTVRLAEVGPVSFLTEPEAAAVHYARQERLEPGEVVAVYDFGGGTFDAAVLRHVDGGFELVGTPEGMERIGGIDFDQAVFAHVDRALGGAVAELDAADSSAMAAVSRLRDECQLAKEQLSQDTDVDIPVLLPGMQTEVRLTRGEFESMIRPRVGETIRALDRAVRSAGLTMDDVAKVLLVGGSSRIPLVGELVREETGRPIAVDSHPKFAIAIGAALVGAGEGAREVPATPAAGDDTVPVGVPTAIAPVASPDHTAPVPAHARAAAGDPDAGDDTTEPPVAAPVDRGATTATRVEAAAHVDETHAVGGGRRRLLLVGGVLSAVVAALLLLPRGDAPEEDLGEDPTAAATEPSPATSPSPTVTAEPTTTVEGVTIAGDGTVQVAYVTSGYEQGTTGYGVRAGWVDGAGRPLADTPWTSVEGDSPWTGLDTRSRPVVASGVCVQTVTPEGNEPVEGDDQCATLDESVRAGMPGDRFVRLDDVAEEDGRYVVSYTPFDYTPELGGDGTWHVHFYWWPTFDEDVVGANVPQAERGGWVAWDAAVFDAFAVTDRPEDATHVCGVVAEHDHTILLQEDGTGYPSGTCVELP